MTRAFPFLAGLIAAVVVFAGGAVQAAATPQAVRFVLHDDAATAKRLPYYRAQTPIAIRVHGDALGVDAMSVIARGPDGSAITAPLVRTGDAFSGALKLTQAGTWTLALSSQLGPISAALADVPLDVVDAHDADIAARIAYALSSLSIGAGLTLLIRRRWAPAHDVA